MNTLAWVIAVIGLAAAGYFGVRAERAETRAERAEAVVANAERLAELSEGYQSALFVRLDGNTLTYRTPRQVQVNGQTFVDYIEEEGALGAALDVFGPRITEDGRVALSKLPENTPISVKLGTDGAQAVIEAIYVP